MVDAAHDHRPIAESVGGRRTVAILATHGHNDHINAAVALAETLDAPIWLHPDDRMLWDTVYPDRAPDADLAEGMTVRGRGHHPVRAAHAGALPRRMLPVRRGGAVLFSGDTLFHGGPGATGRSFSDFPTIIDSIRHRLLVLPGATRVLTGHGDETTIGAEAPHLPEWIRDHP